MQAVNWAIGIHQPLSFVIVSAGNSPQHSPSNLLAGCFAVVPGDTWRGDATDIKCLLLRIQHCVIFQPLMHMPQCFDIEDSLTIMLLVLDICLEAYFMIEAIFFNGRFSPECQSLCPWSSNHLLLLLILLFIYPSGQRQPFQTSGALRISSSIVPWGEPEMFETSWSAWWSVSRSS